MKEKLSFMLIDDDEVFNFIHRKLLKKFDLDIDIIDFTMPIKAKDYLMSIDETQLPDVILLDINMPELNGFEFIDLIHKENPKILEKLNIFIVTSSLNPRDYDKSKQYKCIQGYYTKPIDLEIIMNTINWIIK
jgi:CheY-like chemotaxis protein